MQKIWEWAFREVYELDSDLCIKKLKKKKEKRYLWLIVKYNLKIYTLLKYWILDFNKYEYEMVKKIKEIIPNNIPDYYKLTEDWLIQTIVKDYNWEVSKNIMKYDWSIWEKFFNELEDLIQKLIENWIEPMDIKHNVIVQEYKEGKFKPILFDFKIIWWRTYPFQPWLMCSKKARERKVYRRFERLKKQFNI